jgi:hypothetical protein
MSKYTEEQDDIQFSEPILAQKGVRVGVVKAEKNQWEVKTKDKWTPEQLETMKPLIGNKYDACKLSMIISDDSVKTEHADAKPKLSVDDVFNIENYPFPDQKTGALKQMGKQKLYELEGALGFDPVFVANGVEVEAFVTRNGNKVAPKIEGVKRKINPDFFNAYFDEDGTPKMSNWEGKVLYADIDVETSEKFGSKNVIKRYVKSPVI